MNDKDIYDTIHNILKTVIIINGLDIQTIGDPIDCGSIVAEGSGDVWVDGP